MVNCTSHPVSQSLVTESKECDARHGMMCPCRADFGKFGTFKLHVCVDVDRSPLDICTTNGVVVGGMAMTGAVVLRK